MTAQKPPTEIVKHKPSDPYAIRTIEQLFALFDGGDFLAEVLKGNQQLQIDMMDHKELHGSKGCKGQMSIQINYALSKRGDVDMGATVNFTPPKAPPASASAYIDDNGQMTLYNPMMKQMQGGVRDATPHDPETGEVRDV
ncbi:hypothetical protein [Sulfitobacter pacificus]|uniref:Uncharacterized protein n=2 Tax=Sulfitobacter pacificus TaxID=1499314 RepID=A0ABQ5VGA5_9RHOB|nr:hypothetical protein [Sulfitobacter pacificus]GLQ26107.1 hypothetical protein GCM10007927_09100 [Sulfitobacter pacificus]